MGDTKTLETLLGRQQKTAAKLDAALSERSAALASVTAQYEAAEDADERLAMADRLDQLERAVGVARTERDRALDAVEATAEALRKEKLRAGLPARLKAYEQRRAERLGRIDALKRAAVDVPAQRDEQCRSDELAAVAAAQDVRAGEAEDEQELSAIAKDVVESGAVVVVPDPLPDLIELAIQQYPSDDVVSRRRMTAAVQGYPKAPRW